MSALFAFLHHTAAFVLVGAVAVEFALTRGELSVANARRVLAADAVLGAAAGALLVIGLLRVFLFEKGSTYYLASAPFLLKLALFVALGLASIYPTLEFLSWRRQVRAGRKPRTDPRRMGRVRSILHWELVGIVVILLCAALMARGIGSFG